jgi:hypothetical protein
VTLLEYMTYYSYDVMAALAFGKPMGFIRGEQSDVAASILNTMTGSLYAFGLLQHMPWLMNTLGVVTSIAGPMKEWTDWSVSQMQSRMAVSSIKYTQMPTITHQLGERRQTRPCLSSYRQHTK